MLFLAVTLHNIPEGMAVGVVFAGMISGKAEISAAAALALSIGISIQNFPEGAIVSMPIKVETGSKKKAFWYGFASGALPICNVITGDITAYSSAMKPDGKMLLSGFYVKDIPVIEEAAGKVGLKIEGYTERDKWVCVRLTR